MFLRSAFRLALSVMLAVCLVAAAVGSEIKMTDGTVYTGVTITGRAGTGLVCYSQRGETLIPIIDIARIDGVRMSDIPDGTYPYLNPQEARAHLLPSVPAPPRRSTPAVLPTPPRPPVVNAATPPRPTPRPSVPHTTTGPAMPASPVGSTVASPVGTPTPGVPAVRWRDQKWPWITLAVILFIALWVLSALHLRHILRESQDASARRWRIAAVALPILGYLLYGLTRLVKRWPTQPPRAVGPRREFVFLDTEQRPIAITLGVEASGLENAKGVLQDALLDRASDVHIEPGASECRVRFRIDGVLNPRMKFSPEDGLRLISALKTVAQLDISERRKAQDGRFGGRTGDMVVDVRAATTPSVYGEKLVLRILDQRTGVRGLDALGMGKPMMERYAEIIQSHSGMILATGPTGSGKTSSLYAALTQLDSVRLNIVTIEDPVEYELAGATQIPVNVKAGVTYESGLRSILRQDPDVILVGEMRDLEAAQIALRSSLTGHLVFTSLHTRDAIGTIQRLEEMGIERHLVASALFVVMSQRLVRILCTECREAYPCTGKELEEIGIELPAGEAIYRAVGCRRCEGSGYAGRTGIFEMLVLDEELRQAINAGTSEDDLARLARKRGYRRYREHGAEKILLGITSVDEVLKAI